MPTLDWLNRADAFTTAARVPYRLLETVSSHGSGADKLLEMGEHAAAHGARAGTPYLETNYRFNSVPAPFDAGTLPISHENGLIDRFSAPSPAVPLVVYGEACRLGAARLKLASLTFRHIPYDVKAR